MITTPSGGLYWHLRALRHGHLWQSYRRTLNAWLASWPIDSPSLLLLGPSAGWCLPGDFLARFRHVHAVDLDPLARPLFALRHGRTLSRSRTRLSWERSDFLVNLESLLAAMPEAVVFFANVLGQHGLHQRTTHLAEATLQGLAKRLQGRTWGSVHDRLSGHCEAARSLEAFAAPARIDTSALVRRVARTGTWHDHLTTNVLPIDTHRLLLPWQITPNRIHWLEAGHVPA